MYLKRNYIINNLTKYIFTNILATNSHKYNTLKQFIIINDHNVRVRYSFKTRVYDMKDVKAMYLDKRNSKKKFWRLAFFFLTATAFLLPAGNYAFLYMLPVVVAGYLLCTTPAQPYTYYLVIDTTTAQTRIRVNPKDRLHILKDITGFLNHHLIYRTFNTIEG